MSYPYQNAPPPPPMGPPMPPQPYPYNQYHPHPVAMTPHGPYPPMQMQDHPPYVPMPQMYPHHGYPNHLQQPYPPPVPYYNPHVQPPRFHQHPQQQIHRPFHPQRPIIPQQPPVLPVQAPLPPHVALGRQPTFTPSDTINSIQNPSFSLSPKPTSTPPVHSPQSVPQIHAAPAQTAPAPISPLLSDRVSLAKATSPPPPQEQPFHPSSEALRSPISSRLSVPPSQPTSPVPASPSFVVETLPLKYHILTNKPKPSDPSFGVVISYSAQPPLTTTENALPAPPQYPPRKRRLIVRSSLRRPAIAPVVPAVILTTSASSTSSSFRPSSPSLSSRRVSVSKHLSYTSSTVTEITPATSITQTPTPSSPLSSNTSLSSVTTPTSTKASPPAVLRAAVVPVSPSAIIVSSQDSTDATTPQAIETPQPAVTPVSSTSTSETATATDQTPKSAPKPAAWTTKKSFAELLRAGETAPSAAANPSSVKIGLPISAQAGFSVPSTSNLGIDASLSPRQHSNILQLLTSGTIQQGQAVAPQPIHARGLVNTGNMCFANVILQVLVYSVPFWKLFTELGKYNLGGFLGPVVGSAEKPNAKDGKGSPLTDAIVTFLDEFRPVKSGQVPQNATTAPVKAPSANLLNDPSDMPPKRGSFVPVNVYSALKTKSRFDAMRSGHQEDAEEFLGFLLDTLHEEMLALGKIFGAEASAEAGKGESADQDPAGDETVDDDEWQEVGKKNRAMLTRTMKTPESAITAIFGGKFRSVLKASGRPDSASVEHWRCLQLDIQPTHIHTIEDALYNIATPETVSVQAQHGRSIDATKQVFIEALPPVLILHIKRFVYDPVTGIGKNGKEVKFGPELEIRDDLMSPALKRGQSAVYRLYGTIYHHGLTATGGHYTLDILHPNANSVPVGPAVQKASAAAPPPAPSVSEGWVRFDDEYVRRLKVEEVFGKSPIEDRVAYLLFYRRVR